MKIEPPSAELILPPEGYVFELIHRCRGVPFREGVFRQLLIMPGAFWAVGFGFTKPETLAHWRPIQTESVGEIALRHVPVPR